MNASQSVILKPGSVTRGLSAYVRGAVLLLVLLFGLIIRLYDLKDPPLDFHPTRQLRSAIIARGIYYQISPQADPDLRERALSTAASLENYEPPVFEGLVGLTYRLLGREVLWISRVFAAAFWLIGGWALFSLARRFASFYAALAGLMFYLFLPFSVIAGRSFQPDPLMVMGIILSMLFAYRWVEGGRWKWALITGLCAGLTVLVKVMALFPIAAMLVGLTLAVFGLKKTLRSGQTWVVIALLALPSLLYYVIGLGDRSSAFLSFWTVSLSRMVLTTQFYSDWLGMIHGLMGLTNIFLAVVGVVLAVQPARAMLAGAWAGYGLYGLVFPYQMTTHEYYHLMLVPLVALALVPAAGALIEQLSARPWYWRALVTGLFVFASAYSLWSARSVLYVANYQNEPISWQRMGEALPKNGRIIALTSEYGNRLKYYGWHNISAYWPFGADLRLSALAGGSPVDTPTYFAEVTNQMDYFLVTAFSELDAQPELKALLAGHYAVAVEGDGFVLYDLHHPLNP